MKTSLESITLDKDIVRITLLARKESKFSSLDNTALKHYESWQNIFYQKLKYKYSKVIGDESKDSEIDGMYYYTLIIKLIY